jgi:hypothetical protein
VPLMIALPRVEWCGAEVSAQLKVSRKRVRNLMCAGVFKQGVHFFRPAGLGARFKQSALTQYIEGTEKPKEVNVIELKKGSVLRIPGAERIAVTK